MKITRPSVAEKIADYLHGEVTQAELVDWAERVLLDVEFDETTRKFCRTLSAASG